MYSLVFTIPGTPVLWYGEEIGMGEDLRLEERNSVRTPMQWTAEHNSGFSTAPRKKLRRPVLERGPYSYRAVNVQAQRRDPHSLLNRLERMIRTRKEYPEFGTGRYWILESTHPEEVFAHACEDESGSAVAAVHNFSSEPATVSLQLWDKRFDHFVYLFEERGTELIKDAKISLELAGYGFSWLRLKTKYG